MKALRLAAFAALTLTTLGAQAAGRCSPADVTIKSFRPKIVDECRRSSCPVVHLTGELQHNCPRGTGVQLQISARDRSGNLIDVVQGWPASTRNIPAGTVYRFSMTGMMTYQNGMENFTVEAIDTREW